ncbi:MAG: MFS transporter [Muribaculaceae bacterium]|nr:MFS transporter [Muribaculaceae bacterium]
MDATTTRKNYTLPIIIMFSLFFMIAFVTGYQNPLGDVIKGLTKGNTLMSQLGNLANFIAYAVMGLPAGKLLEKYGYRITALSAVAVGFTGVLITYLSGFNDNVVIYIIGAFVAGFSMCMLNTVVNPLLNSLGSTPNKGNMLIQFGGSCNSLGATLAPVIVGYLLGGQATGIASANPVFYMAMAIFAVAFAVLYLSKLPESPDLGKVKEPIKASGAFRYRNFTLGVIAIFFYVGIEVGIANITYQYISSSESIASLNVGSVTAIAGAVVGVYWLLMLVGRLIGGAVGAKVSSRAMLATVSAIGMILVAMAVISPQDTIVPMLGVDNSGGFEITIVQLPINVLFLIACGLCTSVMWGAIFNLSVNGLGKYTAVASGVFMCLVCGGGILPALQGWIADMTSVLTSFWLVFGLLAYLLFYAMVGSKPKK